MLIIIPSVVADIIELKEGKGITLGSTEIRVKKADSEQGGSCRIKVDNMKDKTLKVGSTLDIGHLYIQAFAANEKRCSLVITPKVQASAEQNYDLIDTFLIPHVGGVSQKKKYEVNGKTFTIQAIRNIQPEGFIFTFTTSTKEEHTSPLAKGGTYTFFDHSMMTVLNDPDVTRVKFGIKIPPSVQPPQQPQTSPEASPESQQEEPPQEDEPSPIQSSAVEERKEEQQEERQQSLESSSTQRSSSGILDQTEADIMLLRQEKLREKLAQQQHKCPLTFCYVNSGFNACLQPHTRIHINDVPSYCDGDGTIKQQREAGERAQYTYECKSNILEDGMCLPLKQEQSILTKVWKTFANLWG